MALEVAHEIDSVEERTEGVVNLTKAVAEHHLLRPGHWLCSPSQALTRPMWWLYLGHYGYAGGCSNEM